MSETVQGHSINYSFVASLIPEVMNALYNEEAFASTSLSEMRDAFRVKQLQGKSWLLNHIKDIAHSKEENVLVIGSWFGFTSFCLHKIGFSRITEVDPDRRLETFTNHLNRFNKSFKHITNDINNVDIEQYSMIVNPSCEHILDNTWFNRIKEGSLVFLHSTDYPANDHPNTCANVEEMISKYPLNLLYAGTLDLGTYKRFMIVGTK